MAYATYSGSMDKVIAQSFGDASRSVINARWKRAEAENQMAAGLGNAVGSLVANYVNRAEERRQMSEYDRVTGEINNGNGSILANKTDAFSTPEEEEDFDSWRKEHDIDDDKITSGKYDYRQAFKDGVEPAGEGKDLPDKYKEDGLRVKTAKNKDVLVQAEKVRARLLRGAATQDLKTTLKASQELARLQEANPELYDAFDQGLSSTYQPLKDLSQKHSYAFNTALTDHMTGNIRVKMQDATSEFGLVSRGWDPDAARTHSAVLQGSLSVGDMSNEQLANYLGRKGGTEGERSISALRVMLAGGSSVKLTETMVNANTQLALQVDMAGKHAVAAKAFNVANALGDPASTARLTSHALTNDKETYDAANDAVDAAKQLSPDRTNLEPAEKEGLLATLKGNPDDSTVRAKLDSAGLWYDEKAGRLVETVGASRTELFLAIREKEKQLLPGTRMKFYEMIKSRGPLRAGESISDAIRGASEHGSPDSGMVDREMRLMGGM